MKKNDRQRGSLTLETAIVLPIFLFMFLMIFGLFSIVSAQNQISHALIQSGRSMSLDPYFLEKVDSAGEAGTKFWGGLSDMVLDLVRLDNDVHFTSHTDWYESENGNTTVAKNRFVGYLAGGNQEKADQKLRDLGVVGGLSGVKFKTEVIDKSELKITISYKLQYVLDAFDMGKIPIEQYVLVKLWK